MDVYVIRLKPTWKPIENPYYYNIVLNWVDALGELHQVNFSGYWDEVLTENPDGESLYVYINKLARPFWDWIAQHPTYNFWDAVNNAADETWATSEDLIKDALDAYLNGRNPTTDYNTILAALRATDHNGNGTQDFTRLGSDVFAVNEDGGTINIWMYEDKGGLIFHKDVQEEAFIHNDEFYFTVTNAKDSDGTLLNGTYRAYPEQVNVGNASDSDAWYVTFVDGKITRIVKGGVDYGSSFRLKDGEGIRLYIPAGTCTIVELGSRSGGRYRVVVDIPGSAQTGYSWLQGSRTELVSGISQVFADVDFAVGAHNVVQTITFHNQTSALSIIKELDTNEEDGIPDGYYNMDFTFEVTLELPQNSTPLSDGNVYYFNMKVYTATGVVVKRIVLTRDNNSALGDNIWVGEVTLKAGQQAVIVMPVPEQGDDINYWVEEDETGLSNYKLTALNPKNVGQAKPAECAEVEIVNWYGDPPGDGYLVITQEGGNSNESFLYRITNPKTGESLIVSVKGGGMTIVKCPSGTYVVEEITDWAWRYEDGICVNPNTGRNYAQVKVTGANTKTNPAHADFTNDRNDKVWLGGESSKDNRFSAQSTTGEEEETNSGES